MKKYLGYTVSVLMAAFTMVGCGKNSDNGSVAVNPYAYGYGSCTTCVGNTQPLGGVVVAQNATLGEAMQLQMYGTSGTSYQTYAGAGAQQIAAQGILHIGNLAQECGLPPGDYQITTQSPGIMSGSKAQGMTMTGSGPAQVVIQFDYIYWYSPTGINMHGYMQGSYGAQTRCEFYYQ